MANAQPSLASRLATLCAALLVSGTLLHEILGLGFGLYLAVPALVAYLLLEWRDLRVNAKALILIALGLGLWLAIEGTEPAALKTGLSRAVYFSSFLIALGFLAEAATSSALVNRAGAYLIAQPPSRRYLALTVGGHLFGNLLNVGGFALLVTMARQANTLDAAQGNAAVQEIRERRMTMAAMRGFCCFTLWSPMSLSVALMLAVLPGTTWLGLAPVGLAVTLVFLAAGWALDWLGRPPGGLLAAPPKTDERWTILVALSGLVVVPAGLALLADTFFGIRFTAAILGVVPAFALGWILVQHGADGQGRVLARTGHRLIGMAERSFPTYRYEAAIFSTSTFLGAVLLVLLPPADLARWLAPLGAHPQALPILLMLAVPALAQIGIGPMISAALLAGALPLLPIHDLAPIKLALALTGGWAVAVQASTLTAPTLVAAKLLDRSPATVAWRWNGAYALLMLAILAGILMLPM